MKSKKTIILLVCSVVFSGLLSGEEIVSYSRYQIIEDREPFGRTPVPVPEPEPEPEPEPPVVQDNSLAEELRMTALWEIEGDGVWVGLVDLRTRQPFTLRVGQNDLGYELIDASYEKEEAVVRRGSQTALLQLASGPQEVTPQTVASRTATTEAALRTYYDRRQDRIRSAAAPADDGPRLTGDELRVHLEEYNMSVIREGLPPLPVELTPEQDRQLVEEGVLDPR